MSNNIEEVLINGIEKLDEEQQINQRKKELLIKKEHIYNYSVHCLVKHLSSAMEQANECRQKLERLYFILEKITNDYKILEEYIIKLASVYHILGQIIYKLFDNYEIDSLLLSKISDDIRNMRGQLDEIQSLYFILVDEYIKNKEEKIVMKMSFHNDINALRRNLANAEKEIADILNPNEYHLDREYIT